MRRPDRARNKALVVVMLGLAIFFAGWLMPAGMLPQGLSTLLAIGGMTVAGLASILAISLAWEARRYRKLAAGHGLIAQWIVDRATWQAFLTFHDQLEPLNPKYPRGHEYRREVGEEGVEILLGERSLIIDGDFQALPAKRNGLFFHAIELLHGPPTFVNMHLSQVHQTSRNLFKRHEYSLRLPVPPEAENEAKLAVAQLARSCQPATRPSIAERYPQLIFRFCLGMLVLSIAVFITGMAVAGKPHLMNQAAAMAMTIVAAMGGIVALLGTIAGWSLAQQMRRRR